jgi:hypothetical protein
VGIWDGGSSKKKFLVLYMADPTAMADMMKYSTPEQQKKGMESWRKWMNQHEASLIDPGAPVGKTKRVDSKGASDTKNAIGGYSTIKAESAEAAAKIFRQGSPAFPDAELVDRSHRDPRSTRGVILKAARRKLARGARFAELHHGA